MAAFRLRAHPTVIFACCREELLHLLQRRRLRRLTGTVVSGVDEWFEIEGTSHLEDKRVAAWSRRLRQSKLRDFPPAGFI